MSKISRFFLNVFGGTGDSSYFGKFGSKRAGTAVYTKDPATIQLLDAWKNGLQEAINASNKAPFMEDINSALFLMSLMQAYQLQEGIPEYDASTTYCIGSIVKKTGTFELYGSLVDTNVGNALGAQADTTNWKYLGDMGVNLKGRTT